MGQRGECLDDFQGGQPLTQFSKHDVINNLRDKVQKLEDRLKAVKGWYDENSPDTTLSERVWNELWKILEGGS